MPILDFQRRRRKEEKKLRKIAINNELHHIYVRTRQRKHAEKH
jgi:hypothetical protein